MECDGGCFCGLGPPHDLYTRSGTQAGGYMSGRKCLDHRACPASFMWQQDDNEFPEVEALGFATNIAGIRPASKNRGLSSALELSLSLLQTGLMAMSEPVLCAVNGVSLSQNWCFKRRSRNGSKDEMQSAVHIELIMILHARSVARILCTSRWLGVRCFLTPRW